MASATRSQRSRRIPWLVVAGVLVAAVSMRGPIVAPTPVLGDIANDLVLTASAAGLITTVPVLMFAILTPLAALVVRRAGAETAVLLTLSGVLLGTLVRSLPGFGGMLAGMLIIGAAITVGNVVMPVIIRLDVPGERVAIVTAAYTAMLNLGSLLTSLGTAPLAAMIGWPLALLAWGVLALGGLALWGVHMRRDRGARSWAQHDSGESGAHPPAVTGPQQTVDELTGPMPVVRAAHAGERPAWRIPVAWMLAGAFGMQSFAYYGISTWLPTFLADTLGTDQAGAGALASMFQGFGIAGAFLVPLLARFGSPIVPALVICGCWLTMALGLLLAPSLFLIWVVFGGLGQAGGFVVIFTTLVRIARGSGEAAGMSALVQGCGYVIAATSAPLVGLLHEVSGGWTLPMLIIVVAIAIFTVCVLSGVWAARRVDASTAA
ncbi:MAG TPA: MFS transporter [Microbacteriaceae bacterium]|nr:MFS transporter [Microbacteriaceae bacterium]HQX35314.1 MFS transporter [Microbacteriaceae bacterium]HQZ47305.1 MFS transporter [Microbacteriaceae bacterium]HRA09286.1 MFS transporter [Microbacteriaceae bacterium]